MHAKSLHFLASLTGVWVSALYFGWLTPDFVWLNLDAPDSCLHWCGMWVLACQTEMPLHLFFMSANLMKRYSRKKLWGIVSYHNEMCNRVLFNAVRLNLPNFYCSSFVEHMFSILFMIPPQLFYHKVWVRLSKVNQRNNTFHRLFPLLQEVVSSWFNRIKVFQLFSTVLQLWLQNW